MFVVKDLADKKKGITDEDIIALVSDEVQQGKVVWQLVDLQVVCGTMELPTATVRLIGPDGLRHVASGIGTGPVDAAYKVRAGLQWCRSGLQWSRRLWCGM